ncbi:hypothetical protein ABNF97_20010 [Plantactinospora sp. B6F1]|uniref:hypothetical protein n=1 Tax=Plantactinospora sp. B6F1 TaxID=3158971 RepID=UPI0013EF2817
MSRKLNGPVSAASVVSVPRSALTSYPKRPGMLPQRAAADADRGDVQAGAAQRAAGEVVR